MTISFQHRVTQAFARRLSCWGPSWGPPIQLLPGPIWIRAPRRIWFADLRVLFNKHTINKYDGYLPAGCCQSGRNFFGIKRSNLLVNLAFAQLDWCLFNLKIFSARIRIILCVGHGLFLRPWSFYLKEMTFKLTVRESFDSNSYGKIWFEMFRWLF